MGPRLSMDPHPSMPTLSTPGPPERSLATPDARDRCYARGTGVDTYRRSNRSRSPPAAPAARHPSEEIPVMPLETSGPARDHPARGAHRPRHRHGARRRYVYATAIAAGLLLTPVLIAQANPASAATLSLTQFVNPFIGSDDSNSPNPVGGGAGGSTVPGPVLPFGMVQFSPDTPSASPSGYRFSDTQIDEYSLTHFNGAGCPNNEDIQLLPITGSLGVSPGSSWTSFRATQTKSSEVAQAGYYKAVESNYGNTQVELTATTRTAQMRLTYPATTSARVLVNVSRSATGSRNGSLTISTSGTTITGSHTAGGFCGSSKTFQVFFAIQFDRTPTGRGTFSGTTISNGASSVSGSSAGGFVTFDTSTALDAMERSSNGGTTQGSPIRGRQQDLVSHQFMPDESSDGLEYVASDFAVAQFADRLGRTDIRDTHMVRAQWWRNMFNDETSFITTRHSDGTWALPLDPASNSNFTEGNAAQYTWMITYNFSSLFNLMGGRLTAIQRLDHHFAELNAGITRPFFYIGNEPQHGVPWAYNFARRPAGTSSAVRRIMNESFTSGAGGLPGNDDLGATSAWYVWAALGMYPATPGADTLALHGPLFPSILVQRPGGNVQINGSGAGQGAQFVQSFSLNGTARTQNFIRFRDIAAGGTLAFTMGSSSASTWGTGSADAPPSFNAGFTPPPAPPALGTNLALNKPVSSPQAACATSETAPKAVDGMLVNNSKFCTLTSPSSLTVDLGSNQSVNRFVVKHAGLGAENTGWNTGSFNIQTSTDGTSFSTAVSVTGNRSSRTMHTLSTARTARFVRLNVTTPTNNGNNATRIYELEVYGGTTGPVNVALNQPATGSTPCNSNEGPEKAFNGSVSGGNSDKWCSLVSGTKFLQVDLGSTRAIQSFTVRHAGAGGESTSWNTRDFDILVSADGTNFTTVVQVRGNTQSVTNHAMAASGRFVRLNVITPTSDGDAAARIYELEVYA